jgi:hypothetical protein
MPPTNGGTSACEKAAQWEFALRLLWNMPQLRVLPTHLFSGPINWPDLRTQHCVLLSLLSCAAVFENIGVRCERFCCRKVCLPLNSYQRLVVAFQNAEQESAAEKRWS